MNPKKQETIEGLILSIIGFIIMIDFLSVDAYIFNFTAPPIIQHISQIFAISPIAIDILSTIGLITLILMMRTERKIGGMK